MAEDLDLQLEEPGLGKSSLVPGWAAATRSWAPSRRKRGQEFGFRLPGMQRGPPPFPLDDGAVLSLGMPSTCRVKRSLRG